MVSDRKDQFVAKIEHQDIGIALVQGSQQRGVCLCGQNDRRLGFTDNSCCPMIRKGRLGSGDDLLSLVGKEDEQVVLFPLLGRFIEPAEGMEIVGELENRIDVEALTLELLRHREANDLPTVDFSNREGRLICTKHLGDLGIQKKLQICAESALNASQLLGRLLKV